MNLTPKSALVRTEAAKAKQREYSRAYRQRHPERTKAYSIKYRLETPPAKRADILRRSRQKKKASDPMHFGRSLSAWRKNNPARWRAIVARWKRKRYANDPAYRLRQLLSSSINKGVRRQGDHRMFRVEALLGCTILELKAHLESKFHAGMTWANKGRFGWHIDHKRPCASFDLSDPEQQKACFHYTNLQPLWWRANLEKKAKCI